MIYLKSFLTGLAALIATVLIAVVIFGVKLWMSSDGGMGVGAIAGPGWPVLVVSVLAFAAGFFWQYLRLSHKARSLSRNSSVTSNASGPNSESSAL
jgi:hypothetical protein